MILAVSNVHRQFSTNNYLFDHPDAQIGDDLLRPWMELKEYARQAGMRACTPDTVKLAEISAFLFIDMPEPGDEYLVAAAERKIPSYLLVAENGIIRPGNFDRSRHARFKKIFTYRDDMVDNKKYFKLNYAFRLPTRINRDLPGREKLCVMIAGNKHFVHRQELYSKRLEAIRWFEKNHPADLDLYGTGWDAGQLWSRSRVINKVIMGLGRVGALKGFFRTCFPSYQGPVERKRAVLAKYRFSICYENMRDIPGYITEKIFDAFFAGCVPVYWGANNITDHIPGGCFIDKRQFADYAPLYTYLKNMPEKEYSGYLDRIEQFLQSEQAYPFSTRYFSRTLVDQIAGDSGGRP